MDTLLLYVRIRANYAAYGTVLQVVMAIYREKIKKDKIKF